MVRSICGANRHPHRGHQQPPGGGHVSVRRSTVLTSDLAKEVAQRLTVAFNFFRGEWFLDTREGLPYYEEIIKKGHL